MVAAAANTVTLQGTGTASNAFVNFQTLLMQGTAVELDRQRHLHDRTVQTGTLNLTGTLGTSPAVSLSSGAALDMAGVSQTFGNVNNAGTIFTLGAGPGTTLTVANYVGASGNVVFNTFLGADNSPSDRLVVNGGTATGTTTLTIHNTTGPGEPTTANGILVVNAINGATTAPGAFALAPGELRAGVFDYRLFQGGITGSDPNNWFLRSTFLVPPATPSAVPPVYLPGFGPTPSNVLPPDPPPATLPPGLYPIIGPEIATYGVVQPIARQMGMQTLGTLHERIGDTLTVANTGGEGAGLARSDWARFSDKGSTTATRLSPIRAPVAGRSAFRLASMCGGAAPSLAIAMPPASTWRLPTATLHVDGFVTNAAATGYAQARTGTLGLNAYSGGGYWTHYGPGGWYLDAVLQGTYYDGNAMTQFACCRSTAPALPLRLKVATPSRCRSGRASCWSRRRRSSGSRSRFQPGQ